MRHMTFVCGSWLRAYLCGVVLKYLSFGCLQPFFGDLLGFIGAIATGPTTFWIPPLMWIVLFKPAITDVSY